MRIEILYVPGCPNYEPAIERLQAVLESQSLQAEVRSVPISNEEQAKALRFPGSPTIRINGNDVEPADTNMPGLACRLYANSTGIPSEEVLRMAVAKAKQVE